MGWPESSEVKELSQDFEGTEEKPITNEPKTIPLYG